MRVRACAKINLGLWVIGRRPDGYHELITVFHRIPLCDEITIEPASALQVQATEGPQGAENLAWKAAELFFRRLGCPPRVSIRIRKGIPIGAGLGGGSADAAAVLLALNRMTGEPFPQEELEEMGAALGADVPFFLLEADAALGRGRGEVLTPVPSRLCGSLLLHYPGFPSPTGEIYRLFSEKGAFVPEKEAEERARRLLRALREGDLPEVARAMENSLEAVVLERFPSLRPRLEALLRAGALAAQVSGSGSSLFALLPSPPVSTPDLPTGSTWLLEIQSCKNKVEKVY